MGFLTQIRRSLARALLEWLWGVRLELRYRWYASRPAPWLFALVPLGVVLGIALLLRGLSSHQQQAAELTCLALNVYHEARGEPRAGQVAVAEVTLNRVASKHYPDSVCQVVYQQRWDRIRQRKVSAFSWTELGRLDRPTGGAWEQALDIATQVYRGQQSATVDGALFYHASYVRPRWSRYKRPVARIGKHIFYH